MGLIDTTNHLNQLLLFLQNDLGKTLKGNKTAAQRVRTNTIKLEKVGKLFRKESIQAEKASHLKKRKKIRKKKRA